MKLANTLGLGPNAARLEGSTPSSGTMRFFRAIRIEEYVTLLISILTLAFLMERFPGAIHLTSLREALRTYLFYAAQVFWVFFLFFLTYFIFKLYIFVGRRLTEARVERASVRFREEGIAFFRSIIRFLPAGLLFLTTLSVVIPIFLGAIATYRQDALITDSLLSLDRILFGTYPFIALHGMIPSPWNTIASTLIIFSFSYLTAIVSLTIIFLFIVPASRKHFSFLVLAVFISMFLSMPLWYSFPALSPNNAYLINVFARPIPNDLVASLTRYSPDSPTDAFLARVSQSQKNLPPVSTIPSMHFVWAAFVVVTLFRFKKILGLLTVPWFFFSSIGTVYLGQHFVVDLVVALPIGACALLLAEIGTRFESKYYAGGEDAFREMVRGDLSKLLGISKRITLPFLK